MSLRRAIALIDVAEVNVAAFCREHRISRDTFYKIRCRYLDEGDAGIEARSRAPIRVWNRTPVVVEDRIVKLRKELTDAGLDNGPETIWWHLQQAGDVTVPSVSTIWPARMSRTAAASWSPSSRVDDGWVRPAVTTAIRTTAPRPGQRPSACGPCRQTVT